MSRNVLLGAIGAGLVGAVAAAALSRRTATEKGRAVARCRAIEGATRVDTTASAITPSEFVPYDREGFVSGAQWFLDRHAVGPLVNGVPPVVARALVMSRRCAEAALRDTAETVASERRAIRLSETITMLDDVMKLIVVDLDKLQAA